MASAPGVQPELFLGVNRSPYPFNSLSSAGAVVKSIRTPLPHGMLRYGVNEALELAVSAFGQGFDIYHPTYFRCMPTIRAKRIVVTHHDCTYEQFPHLFRDAALVLRSRRAMLAKADRVICISEASRQCLLESYPVEASRTYVVHHGLNVLPRSEKTAADFRSRMRRGFLLYVGVRNFHKNFAALLQAFQESRLYDDYDLLALGGGPLSDSEKASIASLELTRSVFSMPAVADEFLAEAYSAADLFVYPSLAEGFGMPPLEAMAAGCPVAASNVSAIPEVCQDAPFYFDPYDVASISRALREGVGDSEKRQHAIARGKQVAAEYSWEECGAKTLAVYRECQ